jgi:hypothetical protein
VSLTTRADLDGLGASEGALITWTIPDGLPGARLNGLPGRPAYGTTAQPMNLPTAARTGNNGTIWPAFAVVLCFALLLVSRLRTNDQSKDKR